ncbi:MAG: DUF364 domain-containing protein [Desulfobacterales bacterium]|nr:MAG: DUF364 domain-containing protein [Desulfobacterales bacterium]
MRLNHRLYELFIEKARRVRIESLSIGLGYTAVTTLDGGIGIAYTYFESKKSCQQLKHYVDYEGRAAPGLLEKILGTETIQRSMALALINALNHAQALLLPTDRHNEILFEKLAIRAGTRVAMVGFFGPLLAKFKESQAALEIIDDSRGIGCKAKFYELLADWAEVLFLTSTSILNNTTEEILAHAGAKVKTVLLGPSTPMVAEAFAHLPVHMLAGTVPVDKAKVLKAIRHGLGTPFLQKFSRKPLWVIG